MENHELFSYITLLEGSSVAPEIVHQVKAAIKPQEQVLVILDSNHRKGHVVHELQAYHTLVQPGSYLVVTDGFMKELADVPRGKQEWLHDNPYEASKEFLATHPDFVLETPPWLFNESHLNQNVTHWPAAWLKKISF